MKYLLCMMCLCSVIALSAQNEIGYAEPFSEGPTSNILFENDIINFGEIVEGDKVKVVYKFMNTGTEDLTIKYAKGSCGCTVPEFSKDPIPPGGTGYILAIFDSANKGGNTSKRIVVTANTNPPDTYLHLKGNILPKSKVDASTAEGVKHTNPVPPNYFEIYPNPSSDYISLKFEETLPSQATYHIYDQSGQLISEGAIHQGNLNKGNIDIKALPQGMYNLQVKMDGKMHLVKHFVKQ